MSNCRGDLRAGDGKTVKRHWRSWPQSVSLIAEFMRQAALISG
jgi:hypothetical protein